MSELTFTSGEQLPATASDRHTFEFDSDRPSNHQMQLFSTSGIPFDEQVLIRLLQDVMTTDLLQEPGHRARESRRKPEDLEYKRWKDFFRSALKEGKELPFEGRYVRGPLHQDFNTVFEAIDKARIAIDADLPPEVLVPLSYQSSKVKTTLRDLHFNNHNGYKEIEKLRRSKRESISELTDKHEPVLMTQTIPQGTFDTPAFLTQQSERSCVGASFLMIMNAITGDLADGYSLVNMIHKVYGTDIIADEDYLKIFASPEFKRQYDSEVQVISFIGADFDMLRSVSERLRAGNPERRVYCMVSLLSDSSAGTWGEGIWHSNVLLEVDDSQVIVHDPGKHGAPRRTLEKDRFLFRWGQAYNRGHIIIADGVEQKSNCLDLTEDDQVAAIAI